MHGHVVAHGDDFTVCSEDGAGVVAALFDVGRKCSASQGCAHLLGDGVVEIFENLELNGVSAHRVREFTRGCRGSC